MNAQRLNPGYACRYSDALGSEHADELPRCRIVRLLQRLVRRVAVVGLGILTVWLIVFVFRFTDRRLPTVLALAITYGIAAYIVLPRIVRVGLKILLRKRVLASQLPETDCPATLSISWLQAR